MKMEGTYTLAAARDRVWKALNDPDALARCVPGCKDLQPAGTDVFKATLEVGVGPVRGTFQGKIQIAERVAPERITLRVEGGGAPGTIRAEGALRLTEQDGQTAVNYVGEAQVTGLIASVGHRMIGGVARMLAEQFFKALEQEVTRPA
ncbi:MAG: carbon monoxide dehydrogenase subunit G [Armatimonadetes bacterium]|nr:carbon monoxide dehydrogenase subunit G [Armatimonadota bacterium]